MNIRAPYLGHIKNERIASIVLPIDDRQFVSFLRAVMKRWKASSASIYLNFPKRF